ncbi:thyrotropin-releasing hormone receptor-like isoform X1 [Daktulosphaira vitifoliae]|uniref:thyrotropin-releasing hormone receptor-like isoform X1 n=1 Tax=Daktulosphaira vitifoliae TaxID=58002 RepID=UPI0021AA8AED|nr:thyrotropin-releasing hormone receptor-like isoform X1 [Daktulosphaira vitifoliae]XP_050533816.1 thyrotropin-releasing hormone receptor-like isoform X1 [Daktulosphaira vitifoliae]XP_050533817.1 thyrotropin-releasing hormone receptor-like isoform X1 [Daktulosphaira vitifoliae]
MISALEVAAFGNDSSPLTAVVAGNQTNDTGSNDTAASVIQFLDAELTFPGYIRITSIVVCVIILGVGVVGNIMVPIVILKSKDMRNSTNIFLINLSIADLMVLLICTPTVFVEVNSQPETWVLGEELCKAVPFVELTVAHASVLTILAISFERYYAICEPLRAGYVCTKTRAMVICLLAWGLAALFTSPMLDLPDYRWERYVDNTMVTVCQTNVTGFWPVFFFVGTISLFFVLPLAVLAILYVIIAQHLTANSGIVAPNTNRAALRYRRQVVLMLGTVVASFFLCQLPFRALILWIVLAPPDYNLFEVFGGMYNYYMVLLFCRMMLYINSAFNPILYNLMSSKFRDGFRRLCGIRRRPWNHRHLGRKGTVTTTSAHTGTTGTSSSQRGDPGETVALITANMYTKMKRNGITVISIEEHSKSEAIIRRLNITTSILKLQQESYV